VGGGGGVGWGGSVRLFRRVERTLKVLVIRLKLVVRRLWRLRGMQERWYMTIRRYE